MKNCLLIFLLLLTYTQSTYAQTKEQSPLNPAWITAVKGSHDLTLPQWGPYTKRYIGISHIPDSTSGIRFDLSVFPGLYNRRIIVPNVLFASDYHPWEATSDLSYFSFRHELEWKDQVYADISYSKITDTSRLIRAEFVNNTDLPQPLELHLIASLNYPSITPAQITLPKNAVRLSALDYTEMHFGKPRATDNLVPDGKKRGEVRLSGLVNGSGLGDGFGLLDGDTVSYTVTLLAPISNACLMVRYRMEQGTETTFEISGLTKQSHTFKGTGNLKNELINLGDLPVGPQTLTLKAKAGGAIVIDGFIILPHSENNQVSYTTPTQDLNPTRENGPIPQSLILSYKAIPTAYGVSWTTSDYQIREYITKDLDVLLPSMIQNHVKEHFEGEGHGNYTEIYLRPIIITAHTKRTFFAEVCSGSIAEVKRELSHSARSVDENQIIWNQRHNPLTSKKSSKAGDPYLQSQTRLNATLLENVVYPTYIQGSYIKHNTPGRWWDSLYTWDSGFIGLGLDELDIKRAFECLNTYLNDPGSQSAFVHHGSMVPVQHYLFLDLWNKTQSKELLEYAYPRLKQYYEFFVGRMGTSQMAKFHSGLLSSFDYFYNSGGWDDYPPQRYAYDNQNAGTLAPVINTAQAIRIAKIMRMAATALGNASDVNEYTSDISAFTSSLQKYSWDETSGYFSYVVHDTKNEPVGFLKYRDEVNYNKGLDGVYPLVAGVGTVAQTTRMLSALKSPLHMWSSVGLSAVDQAAPYYKTDGYWNGTVWMPHQWFFWKSMLDLGESDFAWAIAKRALDLWKKETDATYYSMEYFQIQTGRGAGWHEFGGLSSPIVKWFATYYKPGTFTTGFDVWVEQQNFNAEETELTAKLKLFSKDSNRDQVTVIACMNPSKNYSVKLNNKEVTSRRRLPGVLEINLSTKVTEGTLHITEIP